PLPASSTYYNRWGQPKNTVQNRDYRCECVLLAKESGPRSDVTGFLAPASGLINHDGSAIGLMSALPPQPDKQQIFRVVRFVPCVDGSGLARRISRRRGWSVQPCVRPFKRGSHDRWP